MKIALVPDAGTFVAIGWLVQFTSHRAIRNIVRGSGPRHPGGIYFECGCRFIRKNLTAHVVNPPMPVALPPLNPYLHPIPSGSWRLSVGISSGSYSYPADFIEEARRFGVSVRVAPNLAFELLSPESRMIFIHPRTCLSNCAEIRPFYLNPNIINACFLYARSKGEDTIDLENDSYYCSRDWYALAEATSLIHAVNGELVSERKFNQNVNYRVFPPAKGFPAPVWTTGIFLCLPITSISIVISQNGSHDDIYDKIRTKIKFIPVELSEV